MLHLFRCIVNQTSRRFDRPPLPCAADLWQTPFRLGYSMNGGVTSRRSLHRLPELALRIQIIGHVLIRISFGFFAYNCYKVSSNHSLLYHFIYFMFYISFSPDSIGKTMCISCNIYFRVVLESSSSHSKCARTLG